MTALSWNIQRDDAELLSNILCHLRDGALITGAEPLDVNGMIEDLNRLVVSAGNTQPTLEQSL